MSPSLLARSNCDPALRLCDSIGKKQKLTAVRFGGHATFQRHPLHEKVSLEELWYSREDYTRFRSEQRGDAKIIARFAIKSKNTMIFRLFSKCCDGGEIPPELMDELVVSLKNRFSTTGLERYSSKEVFCDRLTRRGMLLDNVEMLQQYKFENEEKRTTCLRMACEELTCPTVVFAHLIAKAVA
mmetsp:Transcript_7192/g.9335  ORF Transcript_7192/g.9335 Transcript_7192/m.9335 type:complete len:184 (-) Transcript_7192:185-736(-)|eukprot:CAMPEP_0198143968 /NCGR_PEP_ID=MMETSP1443-20131203/12224_1 /TAXON_ID=186043 /ORGANISM="Entomoneis sp., Strain CCMP2396" /LENGTH=183 /DNA_ID=CAMNT_0043807281 /DNA_START=49 /DNA_END=600 /DNA_ORIENTATION=+